jgi:hypothetical protein
MPHHRTAMVLDYGESTMKRAKKISGQYLPAIGRWFVLTLAMAMIVPDAVSAKPPTEWISAQYSRQSQTRESQADEQPSSESQSRQSQLRYRYAQPPRYFYYPYYGQSPGYYGRPPVRYYYYSYRHPRRPAFYGGAAIYDPRYTWPWGYNYYVTRPYFARPYWMY